MWNMDENGPFTNDLAVENGDFPHLCWFTGWQFPHQRGPTKPLLFGLMVVNPKTPHGAQRFPWWLRVISKKKRWLNPTKPYKFMVKYRNDSKWQSFIVSVVTPSWSWDVLGHHITPTMMALMFVTFCWMRMMRMMRMMMMMMMMTTTTTLMIIYIYIYINNDHNFYDIEKSCSVAQKGQELDDIPMAPSPSFTLAPQRNQRFRANTFDLGHPRYQGLLWKHTGRKRPLEVGVNQGITRM